MRDLLNESEDFAPALFMMAIRGNRYDFTDDSGKWLLFESTDFEKNWCRLKFRVYSDQAEAGGYLVDVILSGDMDNLLYELEDIAVLKKKKYGELKVIQRNVNNNVPEKFRYKNIKK